MAAPWYATTAGTGFDSGPPVSMDFGGDRDSGVDSVCLQGGLRAWVTWMEELQSDDQLGEEERRKAERRQKFRDEREELRSADDLEGGLDGMREGPGGRTSRAKSKARRAPELPGLRKLPVPVAEGPAAEIKRLRDEVAALKSELAQLKPAAPEPLAGQPPPVAEPNLDC